VIRHARRCDPGGVFAKLRALRGRGNLPSRGSFGSDAAHRPLAGFEMNAVTNVGRSVAATDGERDLVSQVRCREIGTADVDEIVGLLTAGFRAVTSRMFWVRALERLAEHPTPAGFPKYGYLLESDGRPVGVILLIFTNLHAEEKVSVRCNVSSWYVEPTFRTYGSLLIARALKRRDVTFLNATPARNTWPILEAQGYARLCNGRFVALPMLRSPPRHCVVAAVGSASLAGLDASEAETLRAHASYGCLSLICTLGDRKLPFVFAVRRKRRVVPVATLIYSRDQESFIEVAGSLGRYLARRGIFLVNLDANGRIPGLVGRYRDNLPRFFKGADRPRWGDLAFTELAMFTGDPMREV
jgi:hypothetical protein